MTLGAVLTHDYSDLCQHLNLIPHSLSSRITRFTHTPFSSSRKPRKSQNRSWSWYRPLGDRADRVGSFIIATMPAHQGQPTSLLSCSRPADGSCKCRQSRVTHPSTAHPAPFRDSQLPLQPSPGTGPSTVWI